MAGRRVFLALAASLFLSACASPLVMNDYKPGALSSPWEGRRPRLFLANITDESGGLSGTFPAARKYNGRPLPDIVQDAFVAELARLGVTRAQTPRQADAQLGVTLRETQLSLDEVGFSGTVVKAAIQIKMTLKSPAGRFLWSPEVSGHGSAGGSGQGPSAALNGALASAMTQVEDLFLSGEFNARIFSGAPGTARTQAPSSALLSDIDTLPDLKPAPHKAHAVVIGIERYKAELPSADFAAGDAQLVAKYLTDALGYPKKNVVTLLNDGASRSDIEKYLERWLPNRVEEGDSVFVYFSGHGSPNPVSGDSYLVPFDGDPTYLEQTGYPLAKLYAALGKLPTKDVTVVLDSCFSGAGGRSVLAKGARPLVTAQVRTNVPESVRVFSAAAGNQISQSYQDKRHGLFTYFLLKALGRQAQQGTWDFGDAFKDAAPRVTEVARKEYNSEQVPQWQGARP